MIIDILAAIILVLAIFKGYRKGIIMAVFSFISLIIGLAAAIKLSVVVANYLQANEIVKGKWLSFLSFVIVLVIFILGVKLLGRFVQTVVESILLGWANRIAGILIYTFLYFTIYSVILFYLQKMSLIDRTSFANSKVYKYIQPIGPYIIDHFAKIIPWFKNMFADLSHFFANIAH